MEIIKSDLPAIFTEPVFAPVRPRLQYLKKELDQYFVHMFVFLPKDEEEIVKLWEPLNARIAVGFQTELAEGIEMWNIYFLILCPFKVARQLKYTIEQNKFCSRKLVEDQLAEDLDDGRIAKLLEKKLFTLVIPALPPPSELMNKTTAELIEAEDPVILTALKDFKASNKQFDKFYKHYKKLSHGSKKH
ncbi:hypothetical protein GS399_13155 [Pedobacter sp. HMF7647]|uniref:Uncharacterized protein n=1 Tax=Hufsiella arboris TaxID=2695275 RepID=A0A7K1YBG1_9SPHI|nr:ABC-three component system middle component 1 [Hufsiella arboris]MXV51924.1 hypothetical protein [Hufsiella arboris]